MLEHLFQRFCASEGRLSLLEAECLNEDGLLFQFAHENCNAFEEFGSGTNGAIVSKLHLGPKEDDNCLQTLFLHVLFMSLSAEERDEILQYDCAAKRHTRPI